MKYLASFFAAAFLFVTAITSAGAAPTSPYNDADLSSTFEIAAPVKVPGKTLKAGTYSIRILDHLSDRVLLQIESGKGKAETKFLAVPNASLSRGSGVGPIAYGQSKHGSDSLRGFAFPGGSTVEFVYPKAEAADIAKNHDASVLAIDPQSEGRPSATKLSKDDMELVTLWTLAPTRVGPENASVPAIQAQRYRPSQQPASAQPVEVASLSTPARRPTAQSSNIPPQRSVRTETQTDRPRVKANRQPVLATLPHTASAYPTLFLLSICSLIAAAMVHYLRVRAGAN